MSVVPHPTDSPSAGNTNASSTSAVESVADAVYSLLDAVDSESIVEEFDIGIHNDKHDFESHAKVAVREGLDPSSSLAELADTLFYSTAELRSPRLVHSADSSRL